MTDRGCRGDWIFRTGVLFALLLAAGALWMHFFAPCSWHKYDMARDFPARCLEGFK